MPNVMQFALTLATAPSVEPVSLAEAKAHLRVDANDEDAYISNLITAARQWAEDFCRRRFITQTWDYYLDGFPTEIQLPYPPISSITSIKYNDADGAEQTLATDQYRSDLQSLPPRINPSYGNAWPATRSESNAVVVRCVSGYGAAADVPQSIKQAILLKIEDLFDVQRGCGDSKRAASLMTTCELLLYPYQVPEGTA